MFFTDAERKSISDFFSRFGKISGPETPDLPEKTALSELSKFMKGFSVSGNGSIILGTPANQPAFSDYFGIIPRLPVTGSDCFMIKTVGDNLLIMGENSRSVLHGVYRLEEEILSGNTGPYDIRRTPYFKGRSDGLGHYHSRSVNLGTDTIDPPKAEYLARLGVNRFCACLDGSPFGNQLEEFVGSDVFPKMKRPSAEAVEKLKSISRVCRQYGIEFHMMLWEPALPLRFGKREDYPEDALGKVHRPWGGDENHMDTTFCLSSPSVQEHYRNLIVKFIREYPDVSGIFTYGLDGDSWLCTPSLCSRCRERLVDSDPDIYDPWEIQADFITLLCDAAHGERPDFQVNFWGPANFFYDAPKKMYERAEGYDGVTTGQMGFDHDLLVTFPEKPSEPVRDTLDAAEKYDAEAWVYFAFNRLEAIQIGFPSPFTVADSLKIFKHWGFRNVMEVTGPTPALNQINALTMRRFEDEPDTDTAEFLKNLAKKQFGNDAAPFAFECWERTRDAFDVWKHYDGVCPLDGSQFISRCSTYYEEVPPIILPSVLQEVETFYLDTVANVDYCRVPNYRKNFGWEFIERFEAMERQLALAETAAEMVYEKSPAERRIGLCLYNGHFEGLGRPTMKEYACLMLSAIRQARANCRQRIDQFKAVFYLRQMRDGSDEEKTAAEEKYKMLLADDLTLQKEYADMLKKLMEIRPCLPLTGICEDELGCYYRATLEKISKLEEWLYGGK